MARSRTVNILVATGNPGKAREIEAGLSVRGGSSESGVEIRWHTLRDLPGAIPEPHEDQPTFAGNAALKARYYSIESGMWTLADDSGLQVDALGGEPGVRSARYADAPADGGREHRDAANNRKLIALLQGVPDEARDARFRCALALADGEQILLTAEGKVEGRIVRVPRGDSGFGYDPFFLVPALDRTMAELSSAEKNRVSHRGNALRLLRVRLGALIGAPGEE